MLQGGEGNDILDGGGIQDIFNPTEDTAVFSGSRENYDIETSNDILGQDSLVANAEAFILYSSSSGNLFYNQNGSNPGLGGGGLFAILTGSPNISQANFVLTN